MKIYGIDINIEDLSKSEKKIADFFCKNVKVIPYMTLHELSKEIKVSIATISRFCKSIGFSGFKEFKDYLKSTFEITPANKMESILDEINDKEAPSTIINRSINYLNNTSKNLSKEEFNKAINAILSAKNIYTFSPGPTESIADLFSFRLNRFGLNIRKIAKSGKEIFESLINITQEDTVIIFAFFKVLAESKVILDYAEKIGFKIILITDLIVSEMVDRSDIVLYVDRGEVWEFHSMVAPIALVESIIVAIAMKDEKKSLDKLNYLHELRKEYSSYLAE
ncbi:MurR/RpiR family transcriptional regulator [Orenia marismortui]|uniref:RpiR family transcriptional regulator n=1 Tax=Orenia marismortui TaxID=46469 RepID=A0A4R8HFW8_9FIRM|nr:MurR/RpiR family transcriptional regulator [Orenia marismortui]TDX59000.1 RpiR family transcriptional regulator [Orenia marismortui]